ncbi:MAG TPA: hypothetical protein VFK05_00710 [Polyangiaceae bacterium]|nr:hypothetical protein [Polyangiaceae bacterium]
MRRWMQVLLRGRVCLPILVLMLALLSAARARTFSTKELPAAPHASARANEARPTACNIASEVCQTELLHAVSAMFGLRSALAMPEIRFVSADTLAQPNTGEVQRTLVSPRVQGALSRLGLLPADEGSALAPAASFQQAVYRSQTHDVLLVLPENQRKSLEGNVMLVHELVHAVQAAQGLLAHSSENLDQRLAWSARLEGEAVVRSHRFKAEREGLNPDTIDWPKLFRHWSKRSFESVERARAPLAVAVASFPYARGALWFHATEHSATPAEWPERFADLLAEPLDRTAVPETATSGSSTCSGEQERLGALSVLAFLLPLAKGDDTSAAAAAHWLRSDLLCVRADGSFTWQLVWPREIQAAAKLVQQRAASLGLRAVAASGSPPELRVTLVAPQPAPSSCESTDQGPSR